MGKSPVGKYPVATPAPLVTKGRSSVCLGWAVRSVVQRAGWNLILNARLTHNRSSAAFDHRMPPLIGPTRDKSEKPGSGTGCAHPVTSAPGGGEQTSGDLPK